MGSARRESGRRANESPRLVELRRRFYFGTHEVTNGSSSSSARAPLGLRRPGHARARPPAGGQRELAGRGRVLQLAEPAGGPAGGVPVCRRPAGAGAAGDDRLSPADGGRVGVGGARQSRRVAAQVPVGRRAAGAGGRRQFRRSPGAAAAADVSSTISTTGTRPRPTSAVRGQSARVPRPRRQRRPNGRPTSTRCNPPGARQAVDPLAGGAGQQCT